MGELTAIATAKKTIQETTSGAADLSYGFGQVSFLQRSQSGGLQVVRFFRELAQQKHFPALAQLSLRMDATIRASDGDPFAKVKGLIQDMIETLEKEAEADATEKAYCDKELAESNAKKDAKTTEIKKLSTKIDQMTSRSAQLKGGGCRIGERPFSIGQGTGRNGQNQVGREGSIHQGQGGDGSRNQGRAVGFESIEGVLRQGQGARSG